METFRITGVKDGWDISYERQMQPDPTTGAIPDFDLAGALAYISSLGITPRSAVAAAQPQQPGSLRDRMYDNGGGGGYNGPAWMCPTHGAQDVGPGYQGRGFECKVKAIGAPPPWGWRQGKDKYTGPPINCTYVQNQQPVFACREKSG